MCVCDRDENGVFDLITKLLLQSDANPNLLNSYGKSPIEEEECQCKTVMIEHLLTKKKCTIEWIKEKLMDWKDIEITICAKNSNPII